MQNLMEAHPGGGWQGRRGTRGGGGMTVLAEGSLRLHSVKQRQWHQGSSLGVRHTHLHGSTRRQPDAGQDEGVSQSHLSPKGTALPPRPECM